MLSRLLAATRNRTNPSKNITDREPTPALVLPVSWLIAETSSVPVKNGVIPMVSVKTAADIPKGKILECMEAIHTATVQAPVHLGDIILADIAGTGVDLVATKTVGEMK